MTGAEVAKPLRAAPRRKAKAGPRYRSGDEECCREPRSGAADRSSRWNGSAGDQAGASSLLQQGVEQPLWGRARRRDEGGKSGHDRPLSRELLLTLGAAPQMQPDQPVA